MPPSLLCIKVSTLVSLMGKEVKESAKLQVDGGCFREESSSCWEAWHDSCYDLQGNVEFSITQCIPELSASF